MQAREGHGGDLSVNNPRPHLGHAAKEETGAASGVCKPRLQPHADVLMHGTHRRGQSLGCGRSSETIFLSYASHVIFLSTAPGVRVV
mmetsp:Transcript_2026/g.3746  ORF Transcript_2026/g.3746 Transcript_2026/m.3746 type:complete len:87 (+) Transcript_2026:145-405(+)